MVKVNELKAEIVRQNMNTEEFASLIGMERTTLWRRYSSPNDFTLGEITKIAEVLNLDGNRICAIFFSDYVA